MKKISKKNTTPEYGFGSNTAGQRLMNADGTANVKRIGEPSFQLINIYHSLITMSWRKFNCMVLCTYVVVNFLFACIYYFIIPDGELGGMIYHNSTQKFLEDFFFSAQTLSTVGYGRLNPVGTSMSIVAAIESILGLMGFALITGLLYGRFSRPNAKLLFSQNALIAPFKEGKALMLRFANARRNSLIELEANIVFSYNETVKDKITRQFQTLRLDVNRITYLTMSWTIVHPINEESPLLNLTEEDLKAVDAEFFINIKAIDDTYAQQVHSRTSYKWNNVVWNAKYITAIGIDEQGVSTIDVGKLNAFQQLSDEVTK